MKVLILSYKPIIRDTRVLNQLETLIEQYDTEIIQLKKWNKYKKYSNYFKILNKKKFKIEFVKINNFISKIENFFLKIIIDILKTLLNYILKILRFIYRLIKKFTFMTITLLKPLRTLLKPLRVILTINNLLLKKFRKLNFIPDIVIANDLLTLPTAIFLKFKYKAKIIYDMHEYELDRPPKSNFTKKAFIYILEELSIPFANYITTVSYSIKAYYKKRFKKKIFLILNSPQIQNNQVFSGEIRDKILKNYICIGNVSYGRNVENLINIFKTNNLQLTFMGEINETFEKEFNFLKKIRDIDNIHYLAPVRPDKIASELQKYDASVFLYNLDYKNYDYALPNKFLMSIICNKPIICFKSTELKKFEKRHKLNLNLINNIEELKDIKIMKNVYLNNDEFKFYSKERQMKTLKKLINNLIKYN